MPWRTSRAQWREEYTHRNQPHFRAARNVTDCTHRHHWGDLLRAQQESAGVTHRDLSPKRRKRRRGIGWLSHVCQVVQIAINEARERLRPTLALGGRVIPISSKHEVHTCNCYLAHALVSARTVQTLATELVVEGHSGRHAASARARRQPHRKILKGETLRPTAHAEGRHPTHRPAARRLGKGEVGASKAWINAEAGVLKPFLGTVSRREGAGAVSLRKSGASQNDRLG